MSKKEPKHFKRGDIITNESGKELGIIVTPATLDEMRESPEAFLLNEAETILVKKALELIHGINDKYKDIPKKDLEGNNDYKARVCAEFIAQAKKKRLPLTKLENIAYKSKVCQYWTEQLIGIDFGEKYHEGIYERLQILVSDPDIKTRLSSDNIIDSQTHPEYFTTTNRAEKARMLGIPDVFCYISTLDLDTLKVLTAIFNHKTSLQKNPAAEAEDDSQFISYINSPILNALWAVGQNTKAPKIRKTRDEKGKPISIAEYATSVGITVSFKDFNPFDLTDKTRKISVGDPNTDKLLLQAQSVCMKTSRQDFEIPITEFMRFREISDRKSAIEQAKRACETLLTVSYRINAETDNGSLHGGTNYVQECYVSTKGKNSGRGGNTIYIKLSDKLYQHIISMSKDGQLVGKMDKRVASIPNNQATAYIIFREFSSHLRTNAGKSASQRLSVKNILSYCSFLPLYPAKDEDIGKENYLRKRSEAKDRIITPFVKALEYLVEKGFFTEYTFTHSKGKPLTNPELTEVYDNYNLFVSLYVDAVLSNEPDYNHLIEAKAKQKDKAAKAKKTKAKHDKTKEGA